MNNSVDMKYEFEEWLKLEEKHTGGKYSPNSITQYTRALKSSCNELDDIDFKNTNLFTIDDLDDFIEVEKLIRSSSQYAAVNKKNGNGSFSAGMIKYSKFLKSRISNEITWFVGAVPGEEDEFDRFLDGGVWENGYEDKFIDVVKSIKAGDRIAIKSSYTRKNNLPFENNEKYVSVMGIKAIGIVTENKNDGWNISVDWKVCDPIREWYFNTSRQTIWKVSEADGWMQKNLIDFTFNNAIQDITKFLEDEYWNEKYVFKDNDDTDSLNTIERNYRPNFVNDSTESKDHLSIRKEIKVFKKLIDQEGITPLAIGILGDWGSGKSFFMNEIYKEIDNDKELTESTLQIRFNAWHYSDTNIIVSLSNHIFEELSSKIMKKKSPITNLINEHIKKIENEGILLDEKIKINKSEIEGLDQNKSVNRDDFIKVSFEMISKENENNEYFKLYNTLDNIKDIKEYISSHKSFWKRILVFISINKVKLIPIILVLILTVIGSWFLIAHTGFKDIFKIVNVSSIVGVLSTIYVGANKVVSYFDKIKELSKIQENLINTKSGYEGLQHETRKLKNRKREIDKEIEQANNGNYVSSILRERVLDKNYKEHLGIIHQLRKDLELLNDYITNDKSEEELNKVILYIDDLDRCPADKVSQVLEAVHLLLSFEVFVVFVAADMKWISKCLSSQHIIDNDNDFKSSESLLFAYDYMEKIFQLTYKPQILKGKVLNDFIDGICSGMNEKASVTNEVENNQKRHLEKVVIEDIRKSEEQYYNNNKAKEERISNLDDEIDETIVLTNEDKLNINYVLESVDSTPRRVKRYLNTYQLIKASYDVTGVEIEILLLLAIVIYYPNIAGEITTKIFECDDSRSISECNIVEIISLLSNGITKKANVKVLKEWIAIIERYSFFPKSKIQNNRV